MRLGPLPYLTHVFPLGGRRGTEVPLELHGVNLPSDRLSLKLPADGGVTHWVTVNREGLVSNSVPLAVDDLPEVLEAEPNDAATTAQVVTLPVVINGPIQSPGDADHFAFRAEAGQTLALEVQARRLGSPLDSILMLCDAAGAKLAQNDDPRRRPCPTLRERAWKTTWAFRSIRAMRC